MKSIEILLQALKTHHLIRFTYKKINGEIKEYLLIPDKLKETKYLWGFINLSYEKKNIRQFIIPNIVNLKIDPQTFKPRKEEV